MTYNPNIPQGPPSPFSQVTQVQTNFSQFASIFAANHTALNNSHQGAHENVIFANQSTDLSVTEDLVALYAKNSTSHASTEPQLFFRIPQFLPTALDPINPGNPAMQLTYNTVNTVGPNFQSFLAGKYLLFFGSTSNIAMNITLVPAPTTIISAIATSNTMTTTGTPIPFNVTTLVLTNDTFQITSTLNGTGPVIPYSFTWMALALA